MEYPTELFREVYWSFIEDVFTDQDAFKLALKTHHKSLGFQGTFPKVQWEKVCLSSPKVVLQYAVFPDNPNGEIEEPQVLIEADNGKDFTPKELLFKAHNLVGFPFLSDEDNHFFEGLTFATDTDSDHEGIPVYFLDTGS